MRRRTEITIETSRRLVFREVGGSVTSWCERCLEEVRMITPNEAAAWAGVSVRAIYRQIEDAKLHFAEERGGVLICLDSLEGSYSHDANSPDNSDRR